MMWNKRTDGKASPLRVLYVTGTPDAPHMQEWLRVLAATLTDAGHALLAVCPDGSLVGDEQAADATGEPDFVYASIRGWGDVAGWLHWMTLVRRYRPDTIHLADDQDLDTAIRLALAARLVCPAALAAEVASAPTAAPASAAAELPRESRRPRLLRAWLFYRMLVAQILCADMQTARALIQTYRVAPARISLVSSAEPATTRQGRGRLATAWSLRQRARRAPVTLPQRARHLTALYVHLRARAMSKPLAGAAPERAVRLVPNPHPRSIAPRLAPAAGQGLETATSASRVLTLGGSHGALAMLVRRTDAR